MFIFLWFVHQGEKSRDRKSVCLQFFGSRPCGLDVQPLGDEEAMFILVEMKEVEILLYGKICSYDSVVYLACSFSIFQKLLANAQKK